MTRYEQIQGVLRSEPRKWLITGVAGFIGSNLLEALLKLDQEVVGLDNFATGHERNLEEVRATVSAAQWARFRMVRGDICQAEDCVRAVRAEGGPVDFVLHQAALGSVPRSIADPVRSHRPNVDGFLNMLVAAKDAKVQSFVYASSSSVYGDHPDLPKVEDRIGQPLSPYAATKLMDEIYGAVFCRTYGVTVTGLRYFNVFGRRQSPDTVYAAVIPKWYAATLRNESVEIYGDGETSRDFCYVENVVQVNLLAAMAAQTGRHRVYNVAVNGRTTLNELFRLIGQSLVPLGISSEVRPSYRDFRAGDVRHSQADVSRATSELGYQPKYNLAQGLTECAPWYVKNCQHGPASRA